jgi:F-type H+-transporting ATPase subunit b
VRDSARRKYRAPSAVAAAALAIALLLPVAAGAWWPSLPAASGVVAARPLTQEHTAGAFSPAEAEQVSRQSVHQEPAWVVIARLVNFTVLVGVLVYFLRAPIAGYLARRSTEIRSDLTRAAETREAAARELALIDQKMKALPAEIEALKVRGAEEVAAEEARIRQAAEADRQRLLEEARREIELQLRAAERELLKQAADLSVGLAADRIKKTITEEDQKRLVDRYLVQMQK